MLSCEIYDSNLRQGGDYLLHRLLEQQGIEFNSKGKVNRRQFQWQPKFDKELKVGK